MLIGAHVSPAGGLVKALERGEERGCEAIQIFNQNPRAWKPREYPDEEIAAWHEAVGATSVRAPPMCSAPVGEGAKRTRIVPVR